jgi:hypothetical protein
MVIRFGRTKITNNLIRLKAGQDGDDEELILVYYQWILI